MVPGRAPSYCTHQPSQTRRARAQLLKSKVPVALVLPVVLCQMANVELKKIIGGHHNSINALSFSHDGSLFASGGDDGLINVFQGHGSGRCIHQVQVKAPVTTLLWHSQFGHTILAGDASGDVHTLCLEVQGSANATVSVTSNKCVTETTEASRA